VFDSIASGGQVTVTASSSGTDLPAGFRIGDPPVYYEITPSPALTFTGSVEVCIDYTGQTFAAPGALQILHSHDGAEWVALPITRHDATAKVICGSVDRFSAFTIASANVAPVARPLASPSTGVNEGDVVAFDGSTSSDADGAITAYEWDWENDGIVDATGASLTHLFVQDGTYRVALRVTDDQGAMHVSTLDVAVANVLPSVTVAGPLDPVPLSDGTARAVIPVSFTDPGALDAHTVTVACGDGRTAGGTPLTCFYTTPGVFQVTATVTDDDGQRSSTFDYVVVYDPNGSFVTGGGWIDSPIGACTWSGCAVDGGVIGKASFGFVAKYQ
jgi:PKD repeat protein